MTSVESLADVAKEALRTIVEITTPIKFWAFLLLIMLAMVYLLISKTKWLEVILHAFAPKLKDAHAFRIFRLLILSALSVVVLFLVLAFVAPVAERYLNTVGPIRTEVEKLQVQLEKAEGNILGDQQLEKQLRNGLKLFDNNKYEAAYIEMSSALAKAKRRPKGKLQGYIVATFNGAGKHAEAAREVVERIKQHKKVPPELIFDLAESIRMYTRKNSLLEGLELVDKLRDEYKTPYVSRVFVALPVLVVRKLRDHMHSNPCSSMGYVDNEGDGGSRSEENGCGGKYESEEYKLAANEMEHILAKYPKEPFTELGYYFLGQYTKALEKSRASDIPIAKDVLLFAAARDILQDGGADVYTGGFTLGVRHGKRTLLTQEQQELFSHSGSDCRSCNEDCAAEIAQEKQAAALFPTAVQYLKEIVVEYAQERHADDATYWLGYIAEYYGDIGKALGFYARTRTRGNGDYDGIASQKASDLYEYVLDQEKREEVLKKYPVFAREGYFWFVMARDFYRSGNFERARGAAKRGMESVSIGGKGDATGEADEEDLAAEWEIASKTGEEELRNVEEGEGPGTDEKTDYEDEQTNGDAQEDPYYYDLAYIDNASSVLLELKEGVFRGEPAGIEVYLNVTRNLRSKGDDRAAYVSDLAIARFANDPMVDRFHYFKVRALQNYAPQQVQDAAMKMLESVPKSELIDDALAEALYSLSWSNDELEEEDRYRNSFELHAEPIINVMRRHYRERNAMDNALNHYAIGLWGTGRKEKAKIVEKAIIDMFPLTRFAGYAKSRLADEGLWPKQAGR